MSTDLLRDEPIHDTYISAEVQFTGYSVIQRVCATCVDAFAPL
jgi:hypothetical protein